MRSFARDETGHDWGRDALLDDVIRAGETGHLPRAGGLDDQLRSFRDLYFAFKHERRLKDIERGLSLMGAH